MITIDRELADAVQRVLPAVSRDRKQRPALRCVLVERVGDIVRVVATDSHRLTVCERRGDLVPAGTRVLLDPTTLAEATGVDGEFPDYERLLAADPAATSADVDAAALVDAIEHATDDGPLRISIVDGKVVVGEGAVSIDAGYAHDAAVAAGPGTVTVEVSGETSPVAFRSGDGDVTLVMPVRVATPRRGTKRR